MTFLIRSLFLINASEGENRSLFIFFPNEAFICFAYTYPLYFVGAGGETWSGINFFPKKFFPTRTRLPYWTWLRLSSLPRKDKPLSLLSGAKKKGGESSFLEVSPPFLNWCRRGDLNSQALRHTILSRAWLPISSLRLM